MPFTHAAPRMLYIHWPFCKHKCTYCDFVAFEGHGGFERGYHDALCNEIKQFAATRPHVVGAPIETIFIGGGTPSLYPLDMLEELFVLLRETFDLRTCHEISLEVNPGGQTPAHFETWQRVGITRLSVGVQVLDTEVLKRLNRHQSNEEVAEFFANAPAYFNNLSADMIIGLPGVDQARWEESMRTVLTWPLEHFSLYFLTVHEQTPLYYGVRDGRIALPKEETILQQYAWTIKTLEAAGFAQYEISNFARPGSESRHNQGYWNMVPYQGFGLGAASFDGNFRFSNLKNLGKYREVYRCGAAGNEPAYSFFEELSKGQRLLETLMLGLRQRRGIPFPSFSTDTDDQVRDQVMRTYETLCCEGLVEEYEGQLRLTQAGILLENTVILRLCEAFEPHKTKTECTRTK